MNIILHIGPAKTGTTSIQSFLNSAQQELLSDGVLYPSKGRSEAGVTYQIKLHERDVRSRRFAFKKGPHFTHHLLAWALAGITRNISAESCWSEIFNEIESVNPETVFISSESFAWLSEEQLQTLKALLKDYAVKVLIYFRNPFNWLLSRYNQIVKKGRYHRSFRTFMREQSFHYISYEHLMKRYVGTFGQPNVELRLFDKIKHHDTLENDLIHMLDLDASKYEKYISSEKHNVSLDSDIMNMLRCVNFYQHYFKPQSMHSTRFKLTRKRIIRKRKIYRRLNKIGKPFFNRPVYRRKDLRIYTTLTKEWLPEFLRQYLDPEDWQYYKPRAYDQENG
jgi:hypothetical protein